MKKFLEKIDESLRLLHEQPAPPGPPPAGGAPTDPVVAAGPPPPAEPMDAPETPESELPDEEDEGEDDIMKVKADYAEMVRKALIMAPKHIDDVDYAKLTKVIDTENFEEMNELVTRIVRNNYPHPDM